MESHRNVTRAVINIQVPKRFDRRGNPQGPYRTVPIPPGAIISHKTTGQSGQYFNSVCGNIAGLEDVRDPGGNVDL